MTAGKGRGTGKRGKRHDLAMKIMVDKQLGNETSASEQKGVIISGLGSNYGPFSISPTDQY